MKMSRMLLGTLREIPAEAEIESHKLMLRAGLMRKQASGVYTFLPLGLKALKNVENIIREEMDRAGAQEILASSLQPAELWQESGRWQVFGEEMFKLVDRNSREFCLGPTHEEIFTTLAKGEISSYKQLPLNLYQIQTKFRDERRPRFGVMRCREFIMKDAYSFDRDEQGLDTSYNIMRRAYENIFRRCGLNPRCVEADSGAMGGSGSAEFMIKSPVGEDEIMFCTSCDYASNREKTPSTIDIAPMEGQKELRKVHTPNIRTVDELVSFFNTNSKKLAKTLLFNGDGNTIAVMVRGDREVNEQKVMSYLKLTELSMAEREEVLKATGAEVGFAGPIGISAHTLLVDEEVTHMHNFLVGANSTDYHYENVNYGRDFSGICGDFRKAVEGDSCPRCGAALTLAKGIEVGHIFKLGEKYSKIMGATFVDEKGEELPLMMGCYGIGLQRTLAAVIEECHDENGIVWPISVAPYKATILPIMIKDDLQMTIASRLYEEIRALGVEVLLDDRDERAGVKFKDADLLGIPIRITIGKKASCGQVEYKLRHGGEVELLSIEEALNRVKQCLGK